MVTLWIWLERLAGGLVLLGILGVALVLVGGWLVMQTWGQGK